MKSPMRMCRHLLMVCQCRYAGFPALPAARICRQ